MSEQGQIDDLINSVLADREREFFLTPAQQVKFADALARKHNLPILGERGELRVYLKIVQAIDRTIYEKNPREILDVVNDPNTSVSDEVRDALSENIADLLAVTLRLPFLPRRLKRAVIETAVNAILRALGTGRRLDDILDEVLAGGDFPE
ncbi:MAG: hypothetical protein GY798_05160 [Hyphomicrobiales bacterium]|nr:hypothetical protein [Hyphomicrobiales bacterium]